MTREEHLQWCKQRAREYLQRGELANAVASMMSDLRQHPEMQACPPELGMIGLLAAASNDRARVSAFIEGFR
jgi:hypothetical protein